jgi:zinc transport system substrate-binding protein
MEATAGHGPRLLELGSTLDASELLPNDPHVWLDPVLAAQMIRELGKWLGQLDPPHAGDYVRSATAYANEVEQLLGEYESALSRVRVKKVVTSHASFTYLFRRLGIEVLGVIEKQPGKEPSSREIAELVSAMHSAGLRVVFVDPQSSSKTAASVAREIGGRVCVLDPIGDPNDPRRNNYVRLMRFNMQQLVDGLAGVQG